MNYQDRRRIDFCHDEIVPKIDLNKLLPKLIEHKVYGRDDVNMTHWMKTITKPETISDVYKTIKTRGPNAFKNLLISLRESGHESLADILEGHRMSNESILQMTNMNAHLNVNDNFYNSVQLSTEPLQIKVIKATKFMDSLDDVIEKYPMRSKPRGLVLIISNIYFVHLNIREAAVHDENNLQTLFTEMGFKVILHRDQTAKGIMEKVIEFSKLKELRSVDSAFVIITSHGRENKKHNETEILGINDTGMYGEEFKGLFYKENFDSVLCQDIVNCFTSEACPNLAGKPKVFIFQVCRGDKEQKAVQRPRHSTDTGVFKAYVGNEIMNDKTIRNHSDTLIVHSTLPGHVAFRDNITGTWFIQILCEVFMNYAYKKHVEDLMTLKRINKYTDTCVTLQVDSRVNSQRGPGNTCQTVHRHSIGFKHCYLNPGLFEN